jgi:hypothetical protein
MSHSNHWFIREEFVSVLEADCRENFERLKSDSSDLNRRNYTRSLFVLYESTLANMRETLAERIINRKTAC